MLDENIRVMRREKGLTQEQLAEVMGVSTASVSKWETGVAAPELGMLAAMGEEELLAVAQEELSK